MLFLSTGYEHQGMFFDIKVNQIGELSPCTDGSWLPSHRLLQSRAAHTSWASPRGGLLLGGVADQSSTTSELLAADTETSVQHFPLKYQTV